MRYFHTLLEFRNLVLCLESVCSWLLFFCVSIRSNSARFCASPGRLNWRSIASTSKPVIPSSTSSMCVGSYPSPDSPCCKLPCSDHTFQWSAEPPHGIFHTVGFSTCHQCLILSSLPVFSKGADFPSASLLSHLFIYRQFWDELLCQPSLWSLQCLPFCGQDIIICLCTCAGSNPVAPASVLPTETRKRLRKILELRTRTRLSLRCRLYFWTRRGRMTANHIKLHKKSLTGRAKGVPRSPPTRLSRRPRAHERLQRQASTS